MSMLPFEQTPAWQRGLRGGAVLVSLLLHLGLGWGGSWYASQRPEDSSPGEQWVELAVVEPPAPEVPEPEQAPPEPDPVKPKPKPVKPPEPVDIKDTVKDPPPEQAPQERKTVRRVQGMSATSFAPGGNTGFDARAGTGLDLQAGGETMSVEEAAQSVAFATVTVAPTCRTPRIEITKEINDQLAADSVDGSVRLRFDVAGDGRVTNVQVTKNLHPVADRVCVEGWRAHRCTPGRQGDTPVKVTGMTYGCAIKGLD